MTPFTIYLPDRIFTGHEWLEDHAVFIRQGKIEHLVPASEVKQDLARLPGCFMAPAFIDIQIYGAHKKLLAVYPEPESLFALYDYCTKGGAALFLPTVATHSTEVFRQCIDAVRNYWQLGGKGVYGLHIEGPWINEEKKGAHVKEFIHAPAIDEVKALLEYGKDVIKVITLAPEVCSEEVIRYIQEQGIVVSAGHSNATYEEAVQGFNTGIKAVTHLFNAMSPLQHRSPGLVGAVLNDERARASIIPDGHHVDWAAISIAKKIMGDRLFVITDAVTETDKGFYHHHLEGDKYTCNGTLSGSALTMHKAVYNLVHHIGMDIGEALRMCSLYPAQVLGCDHHYGKIAPGYAALFVVLDQQLQLKEIITG